MRRLLDRAVFYGVIFLILAGTFYFLKDAGPWVDERYHQEQIQKFVDGDFSWSPLLPQLPGYHVLMAGLAWLFDDSSLITLRKFTFVLGLLSILVFALALKKIHGKVEDTRLLQYVFFPLVLPFFFLNYTEILSLLLVLLGLYLGLERQYFLAGLASCLSVMVRQNNVIWLLMMPFIFHANQDELPLWKDRLIRLLKSYWLFYVGIIAFVLFVYFNEGVAFGDKRTHPTGRIYSGNLFLALFLYFMLFLPSIVVHFLHMIRAARINPYTPLVVAALLALYMFNFQVDHHYNQLTGYFLHNTLLQYFTSTLVLKLLFFIPILIATLDIMTNPLKQNVFALVYPLTVFFLLPSWLIETRYCLVPFVLLLLFRKDENPTVENITCTLWAAASIILIYGIQRTEVFP